MEGSNSHGEQKANPGAGGPVCNTRTTEFNLSLAA
jgi:hypothetical protein